MRKYVTCATSLFYRQCMTSNNRTSIFLCARVLTCTNTYRETYLRGIPKNSIHTYTQRYVQTTETRRMSATYVTLS